MDLKKSRHRLLLHTCCAPCATYPLSVLLENYDVTAYFYDPNIHPRAEYEKRLNEARKYFEHPLSSTSSDGIHAIPSSDKANPTPISSDGIHGTPISNGEIHSSPASPNGEIHSTERIELIEAVYDDARWFAETRGHESDPERGERCHICYRLRLEQTAKFARENAYEIFTTVLSVSPHKDATALNAIGAELAEKYGVEFLPADWKKQGGFEKSVQMSRAANLERQDYCGCVYSAKNSKLKVTN